MAVLFRSGCFSLSEGTHVSKTYFLIAGVLGPAVMPLKGRKANKAM